MLYNLVTGGGRCGWNLSWKLIPISEGDEILFSNNRPVGTSALKKNERTIFPFNMGYPLSQMHANTTITETLWAKVNMTCIRRLLEESCWVQPSPRWSLIVTSERLRTWIPRRFRYFTERNPENIATAIKPGSPKTCEFLKLLSIQPCVFRAMFNRSRIPGHCTLNKRLDFQKTFKNWLLTRSFWGWRYFTVRNDLTRNSNRDFAKPGEFSTCLTNPWVYPT